jgi:hypothetical protein
MAGAKGVNPKAIGEKSEGQIISRLLRTGKTVLKPLGDNQRYDLVLDEGDRFVRIQCKTGRLRNGAVEFATCSSYAHRGLGTKDYRGQADIFAVYCPDTDGCYLVPVDAVGMTKCSLRIQGSRNGQAKYVRLAAEFELAPRAGLEPATP